MTDQKMEEAKKPYPWHLLARTILLLGSKPVKIIFVNFIHNIFLIQTIQKRNPDIHDK